MFTRHRLGPTNKLDCPHAMGTNAFSRTMIPRLPLRLRSGLRQRRDFGSGLRRPLGASTFCCYHPPIRLLRPAPRSGAGPGVYRRRKPTHLRFSFGAGAAKFQASRLRVRRHAGACSSSAQRATAGYVQRSNCPTQAKRRLEWATCQRYSAAIACADKLVTAVCEAELATAGRGISTACGVASALVILLSTNSCIAENKAPECVFSTTFWIPCFFASNSTCGEL